MVLMTGLTVLTSFFNFGNRGFMVLAIILFICVLFVFFSYQRGWEFNVLNGLKAFLPSWRFFDVLGHEFWIEINEGQNKPKKLVFLPLKHKSWQIFYNPWGNLRMAQISALSLWVNNPQDFDKAFIPRLVEGELRRQNYSFKSPYQIELWSLNQKSQIKEIVQTWNQ